jgi:hypothetical protein
LEYINVKSEEEKMIGFGLKNWNEHGQTFCGIFLSELNGFCGWVRVNSLPEFDHQFSYITNY